MNVAINKTSPFQREVREWHRVDPATGALLSGRLEADRWNNGPVNKYGKVVDSQNISTPNGMHLQQRKQLEVLQSRTDSGGSLQVIRASTVQTSSSRTSMAQPPPDTGGDAPRKYFGGLHSSFGSAAGGHQRDERSKSASTEDMMSIGYDPAAANDNSDDDDNPTEWRRVSKIRRSLQYPKTVAPRRFSSRPTDLPANLTSISQIKKDLQIDVLAKRMIAKTPSPLPSPGTDDDGKTIVVKKATLINADSLSGIRGKLKRLSDESLYKDDMMVVSPSADETNFIQPPSSDLKSKSLTPADWYLRRKSYGFEDMPLNASAAEAMPVARRRIDASTDSGLGRSGEISATNWQVAAKPRGTIITLSGQLDNARDDSSGGGGSSETTKRHSIAVDDSKYVRDTKMMIHLNSATSSDTTWNKMNPISTSTEDAISRRAKRVEFCKTEVHFAAESGRVNIIETAAKPPSTNNFRRRRRSSSINTTTSSSSSSVLEGGSVPAPSATLKHFGDDSSEEQFQQLSSNIAAASSDVKIVVSESFSDETLPHDGEQIDEISLRGILKNMPVKPRPYHLGENLENSERLWGVRLKSVDGVAATTHQHQKDQISEIDRLLVSRLHEEQRKKSDIKTVEEPMYNPWEEKGLLLNQTNHCIESLVNKIPHEDSANLKSTSLIMRTIKSASQFDEVMKSLSIGDVATDGQSSTTSQAKSGSDKNTTIQSISKTSSTSSCYSEGSVIKLNSISNSSSSTSSLLEPTISHHQSAPMTSKMRGDNLSGHHPPIAAPRIKKIGSSTTGLSHQLSQLRRIYEAADQSSGGAAYISDENDNGDLLDIDDDASVLADNEVKRYLAAAVYSSEENAGAARLMAADDMDATSEVSGSWSRIRARKNVIKQTKQNDENHQQQSTAATKGSSSHLMSIQLHSPTNDSAYRLGEPLTTTAEKPVAKPRNTNHQHDPQAPQMMDANKKSTIETIRKPFDDNTTKLSQFRPVNGARKLREHELSYFGLNVRQQQQQQQQGTRTTSNAAESTTTTTSTAIVRRDEGKLCSDKPDLLLNHSPKKPSSLLLATSPYADLYPSADPIYENLKDYRYPDKKQRDERQRDEQNLKELNDAANEIKQAITVDKEKKHHRSTTANSSATNNKPFATIREEDTTATISVSAPTTKQMISKGVQVSRGYNHTLHKIKPLHRTSSASSTESIISIGRSTTNRSARSTTATSDRDKGESHRRSSRVGGGGGGSGNRHSGDERQPTGSSGSSHRRHHTISSRDTSVEDVHRQQHHRSRREKSEKSHQQSSTSRNSDSDRTARNSSRRSHQNKPEVIKVNKGTIEYSGGSSTRNDRRSVATAVIIPPGPALLGATTTSAAAVGSSSVVESTKRRPHHSGKQPRIHH